MFDKKLYCYFNCFFFGLYKIITMLNNDIGITDAIVTQEELEEQKILAQKKEKKVSTLDSGLLVHFIYKRLQSTFQSKKL